MACRKEWARVLPKAPVPHRGPTEKEKMAISKNSKLAHETKKTTEKTKTHLHSQEHKEILSERPRIPKTSQPALEKMRVAQWKMLRSWLLGMTCRAVGCPTCGSDGYTSWGRIRHARLPFNPHPRGSKLEKQRDESTLRTQLRAGCAAATIAAG